MSVYILGVGKVARAVSHAFPGLSPHVVLLALISLHTRVDLPRHFRLFTGTDPPVRANLHALFVFSARVYPSAYVGSPKLDDACSRTRRRV
eukprot:5786-Pleurochrysis_carterae.AAC.1